MPTFCRVSSSRSLTSSITAGARRRAEPDKRSCRGLTEMAIISSPVNKHANGSAPVAKQSEELPNFISRPKLTPDELENLLDQFSAGPSGKVLPPDFSRADRYDDHD